MSGADIMNAKRICTVVVASVFAGGVVLAQGRGGGSQWLTAGGDAQRTSWIRSDAAISIQAMSKPGFELQWKTTLDNPSRGENGLSQGVTANGVTLFVPMSIVTARANNVYAIDNDTGYTVWQRHFDMPVPTATAGCPGGITAAATRIVAVAPPAPPAPAGAGAGQGGGNRGASGYRGAVGEPGQGVPNMRTGGAGGNRGATPPGTGAAGASTPPPDPARAGGAGAGAAGGAAPVTTPARAGGAPGGAAPGGRAGGGNAGIPGAPDGGGPGGGFGRPAGVGYVISSDGVLHVLGLASGKDLQKPAPYLPPNARWSDPIAVNDVMYTATSQNCGGAPNGIWAIDLAAPDKPVTSWKSTGGGIIGALAFATDGTLLAAIGPGSNTAGGYTNAIVAFDPKTLRVKDWFTSPAVQWASGPLVFKHNDKDIVAAATRDGRALLLDAASLGGVNHATPLSASRVVTSAPATFAPDALAMWQETDGRRWLLVPVAGTLPADLAAGRAIPNGAIVALKVADNAGTLSLQPGWVSGDLTSPITPIIVNGVVFAVSRGKSGSPARLYAINGVDGTNLWNSGTSMTSHMTGRSFWSATGQVYVGTADNALYAFGFAMDRK
jgi:hypothetical protein